MSQVKSGVTQAISLGGVGGCELAYALRASNFPAYPYDWIVSAQSFVIKSFEDKSEFFAFDDACVYLGNHLIAPRKNAVMAHDFVDFDKQVQDVIDKYERRYDRIEIILNGRDPILFVRILENLEQRLVPLGFYDNIFRREEEDLSQWDKFIDGLINKYSIRCKLLLITDNPRHKLDDKHQHLILRHVQDKGRDAIRNVIAEFL